MQQEATCAESRTIYRCRHVQHLSLVFYQRFQWHCDAVLYQDSSKSGYSLRDILLINVSIIATVTAMQLFSGAVLGYVMIKLVISHITKNEVNLSALTHDEVIAGTLHELGSICTNLGFIYGSASDSETVGTL